MSRKSKSMFVKIWIYSYEGSLNWILSWLILSDISVVARKCFCRDPTTKAFYFYLPHPIELDFHVNLYSNIFSSTYSFLLRRQGVTREMSWTQNYTHNTLLLNAPYLFIYDRDSDKIKDNIKERAHPVWLVWSMVWFNSSILIVHCSHIQFRL